MPKLKLSYLLRLYFLFCLLMASLLLQAQHQLVYHPVDRNSGYTVPGLALNQDFADATLAQQHLTNLLLSMQLRGYWLASADSIWQDNNQTHVKLYWGACFTWSGLRVDASDESWLGRLPTDPRKADSSRLKQMGCWKGMQEQLLELMEDEGYPFARILLDSLENRGDVFSAKLTISKGPLYHIDSIRLMDKSFVNKSFLHRYLEIPKGSIYRKSLLQQISPKLALLPYLSETRPWDLAQLGTGATLQLYLEQKRSSQVNVLVGLLPATGNTQNPYELPRTSFQFTGEANIQLKNPLGGGESILFNWQQFQVKAPRLNLAYQQPFVAGSAFGMDLRFDLLKKDSSYVNIHMMAGLQLQSGIRHLTTLYVQQMQSQLLFVDTLKLKLTRKLPPELDIRTISVGLQYEGNTTNYRFNPVSGNEVQLNFSLGTRQVARNSVISQLKGSGGFLFSTLYDTIRLRSFQFRLRGGVSHYFKLGGNSTLKSALQVGWVESPSIFRNELFQIGGYKILRGFDEESIYASRFAVLTAEYRYLIARNSFLFAFADGGWSQNAALKPIPGYGYLGAGLGISLETQAGQFNISLAAGKRSDLEFNARQSRIHLGYINFF